MPATTTGWQLDVRRGPGWLVVKPRCESPNRSESFPLAQQVWSLLERHFTYRLALELEEIDVLNSYLVGQLLVLYRRISDRGGAMRVCGLSSFNQRVLRLHGLIGRLPSYGNLQEALMASCPRKPR